MKNREQLVSLQNLVNNELKECGSNNRLVTEWANNTIYIYQATTEQIQKFVFEKCIFSGTANEAVIFMKGMTYRSQL